MLKWLLSLLALTAAAPAPVADTGTVTFHVTNLRNTKGLVTVDLCPEAGFLRENCPYTASVPAQMPVTTLIVKGVLPGRYAAQLAHDENRNGKVDTSLFGIPKEGVGFSRDALKGLSRPKWADAQFAVVGGAQAMQVRMRYFLGQPGPQGR